MRYLAILLWCVLLTTVDAPSLQAQPRQWVESSTTKRIGLVIGNTNYAGKNGLTNPVNDARAIAAVLKECGFDVLLRLDRNTEQLDSDIDEFSEKLTDDCVAVFYYSGHGAQITGENYMIPVDFAGGGETVLKRHGKNVSDVLAVMEEHHSPLNILILDACRDNPFTGKRGGSRGLAKMDAPTGTLIAYATRPGATADDNSEEKNGLYTKALLTEIRKPGIALLDLFNAVSQEVYTASNGKQEPRIEFSRISPFVFLHGAPRPSPPDDPPPPAPKPPATGTDWKAIADWAEHNTENKPLTLDLTDVSVPYVLRLMFSQEKASNVSVSASVTGIVTLKLEQQPFTAALRSIQRSSSIPFTMTVEKGVLYIRPADNNP